MLSIIQKRWVMLCLFVVMCIFGYYSWKQLSIEAYPDIADVTSQVVTQVPGLAALTEGIVKGTEQRLSRALFKVAVELGAITHMLAAINDIDDETMVKLRAMCTDEVRRINGVINFERAVRYQRN